MSKSFQDWKQKLLSFWFLSRLYLNCFFPSSSSTTYQTYPDINRLYPSFCSWKLRIMIAKGNLRSNFGQQFGCFFSHYKSNRLLSWHFGKNVALLVDNFQKFGCYAKINCWMLGYLWHPWFVHQETSCHCEYEAIANAAKDLVALVGRTSTAAHVGTRRGRTSSRSWGDGSGSL